MFDACALVKVVVVVLICIAFTTELNDNWVHHRETYDQAAIYIEVVCNNADLKKGTVDVTRCHENTIIVQGTSPFYRAVVETVYSLHPCHNGKCDSLVTMVGFGTLSFYTMGAVLVVVVFALSAELASRTYARITEKVTRFVPAIEDRLAFLKRNGPVIEDITDQPQKWPVKALNN